MKLRKLKTSIAVFALLIMPTTSFATSTPTFSVFRDSENFYEYATEDDVIIYDSFEVKNMDSSRGMVLNSTATLNGQDGWISFSSPTISLQAQEQEAVSYSINVPAGVCSGTYSGTIIIKLISYDLGPDESNDSSVGVTTAIGKKVTLAIENPNNGSCTAAENISELNAVSSWSAPSGSVNLSLTSAIVVPGPSHPDPTPYNPSSGGGGGGDGSSKPKVTTKTVTTTPTATATPSSKLIVYDICKENYTSPFTDIHGHYAEQAINFLYNVYTIDGYKDGTFKPDQNIIRAELTKMALLTFKYGVTSNLTSPPFKDVPLKEWYAPYIASAKILGIVNGYKDGYFRPAKSITRAEALKIILFAAGRTIPPSTVASFTDVATNDWFHDIVNYAYDKGIVSGIGKNKFGPNDLITRGQVAVILRNSVCSVDTPLLKSLKEAPHR